MTRMEERLKDALLASADRVQDHRLRPFPDLEPGTRRRSRLNQAWLVPVAAAASVVLVIGLVLAVTGGPKNPAGTARTSPSVGGTATGFPKYFADLEGLGQARNVVVRSTSTGSVVASVAAPAPRGWTMLFDAIAAAPDDRTFYVGYQAARYGKPPQVWIYRLTITNSGSATPLTPIKGGVISGSVELGTGGTMAVSPDGTKLALTADTTDGLNNNTEGWADKIIVVDLPTGARSTWQGGMYRSGKTFTIPSISWTPDGQSLIYLGAWCNFPAGTNICTGANSSQDGYRDTQVRSLSVATGGGPLDRSVLLFSQSGRYPVIAAAIAGPDGSDLSLVVLSGLLPAKAKAGSARVWSKVAVEHVSAVSGSLLGVDYRGSNSAGIWPAGVWFGADPSGQYLFFGYDWGGGTLIGWSSNGTFHWRLVPHYTLGPIAW
jgi:hypothetical protein